MMATHGDLHKVEQMQLHVNQRVKLSITIRCHDENAWKAPVDCSKATVPETRAKLHENERILARRKSDKDISINANSGLMCYWRIYDHPLTTASDVRTNWKLMTCLNTETTTLTICNATRYGLQVPMTECRLQLQYHRCWKRNADTYTRLRGRSLL